MSADPLMLGSLEKVSGNELKMLRKRCMVLMDQDGEPTKFPGAQPVSFERKHLQAPETGRGASIVTAPYFAAEKTDGVRYMLLIVGSKGTFAVDRNFDMRRLPPMRFPTRADPSKALDDTLLDGELVGDTVGTKRPRESESSEAAHTDASLKLRFLAYDACRVAGRMCCNEPLRTRLMLLRREVLSPRYTLAQTEPSAFEGEHFTVELKDFFATQQLPHIFSHVDVGPPGSSILYAYNDPLRKLSHGNDGIIFTPARDPYRAYTCPSLLKWKPANMNSIDFRLQRKWRKGEPRFILLIAEQTILQPYEWITFNDRDFERFSKDPHADKRIIECVYDPSWHTIEYNPDDSKEDTWDNPYHTKGGWRFERIREDKLHPNDISTVKSVEVSVRDGVTAPELLRTLGIRAPPGSLGAFEAPQVHAESQDAPTSSNVAGGAAAPAPAGTATEGQE